MFIVEIHVLVRVGGDVKTRVSDERRKTSDRGERESKRSKTRREKKRKIIAEKGHLGDREHIHIFQPSKMQET